MRGIKELEEMISKSLKGAESAIKKANFYKETNPALAKTYFDISTDKMRHVTVLHEAVVREIDEYQKKHGNPPEAMQAIYDWVHEKDIEYATEIKAAQAMFRGA